MTERAPFDPAIEYYGQVLTHRYVARIKVELLTPLLISTGQGDEVADQDFVTDANGLPMLPGTSIAGALRSLCRQQLKWDDERLSRIFGFQERLEQSDDHADKGAGSRLHVSCGVLHDSQDAPVDGRISAERLRDPILQDGKRGAVRDHVRLTHRGTAALHGKFDERHLNVGHRFTFELLLEGSGSAEDSADWNELLDGLHHSGFRLGGKTRRGYGSLSIQSVCDSSFDLREADQRARFLKLPVRLDEDFPIAKRTREHSPGLRATVRVSPDQFWLFGTGRPDEAADADIGHLQERRVSWQGDRGALVDCLVVPASSVKGAVAHRVAYHHNRLAGEVIDVDDLLAVHAEVADEGERHELRAAQARLATRDRVGVRNPAVRELFGFVLDRDDEEWAREREATSEPENARRGRVLLDDLWLANTQEKKKIHHNGIDPYTGGTLPGILFSEFVPWQGQQLDLTFTILDEDSVSMRSRQALDAALQDLATGRLTLGGGFGRGHGAFTGRVIWSDPSWVEGGGQ